MTLSVIDGGNAEAGRRRTPTRPSARCWRSARVAAGAHGARRGRDAARAALQPRAPGRGRPCASSGPSGARARPAAPDAVAQGPRALRGRGRGEDHQLAHGARRALGDLSHYLDVIAEKWRKRRLLTAAAVLERLGWEDGVSAEEAMREVDEQYRALSRDTAHADLGATAPPPSSTTSCAS